MARKTNVRKLGVLVVAGILAIALLISAGSLFESLEGGEIHVKQAAISGDLTVIVEEGLYGQTFGRITKYDRVTRTYLSNDELDGGKGLDTQATMVRFGDGGTADVGSVTEWSVPLTTEEMIKIHRTYHSMDALKAQVRQWIIEVEKQTASTFRADETYNTRRAEFMQLISEQIINGLYATETVEVDVPTNEIDEEGNTVMSTVQRVQVKRDENGFPIIIKKGIFNEYGLTLVNHSIKDIDYDETIDALIAQKKKAEQEKAVAITNAEKALQDAITAEAQGQARIAQAKAEQEVIKITEVTQAEKNRDVAILRGEQELRVAELARQRAEEEAEAELVKKRADAEANKLLVQSGLTPQQRAEWDYKTAVDSAKAIADGIAKADFPEVYMAGGGDGDSASSVLDSVAVNQMLDIVTKVNGN